MATRLSKYRSDRNHASVPPSQTANVVNSWDAAGTLALCTWACVLKWFTPYWPHEDWSAVQASVQARTGVLVVPAIDLSNANTHWSYAEEAPDGGPLGKAALWVRHSTCAEFHWYPPAPAFLEATNSCLPRQVTESMRIVKWRKNGNYHHRHILALTIRPPENGEHRVKDLNLLVVLLFLRCNFYFCRNQSDDTRCKRQTTKVHQTGKDHSHCCVSCVDDKVRSHS